MATLPSLRPNGTISTLNVSLVNGADAHTILSDFDPSTVDAADVSYIFDSGTANADLSLELTDTPGDFGAMESPLTVRAVTQSVNWVDDVDVLSVQIFAADGTTAYTNQVTLATESGATKAVRTASLTVNATGLAADKIAWDAARLRMLWTYTAFMAKDNVEIRVWSLEVDGTYTTSAPAPQAGTFQVATATLAALDLSATLAPVSGTFDAVAVATAALDASLVLAPVALTTELATVTATALDLIGVGQQGFEAAVTALAPQDLAAALAPVVGTFEVAVASVTALDLDATLAPVAEAFEAAAVTVGALDATVTPGAVAQTFAAAIVVLVPRDAALIPTDRLVPVAILENDGYSGAVTDIDEPVPDTGDFMRITNPAAGAVLVLRAEAHADPEDHRVHSVGFVIAGTGATLTPVWRSAYVNSGSRGTVVSTGDAFVAPPTPTRFDLELSEAEAATVLGSDYTDGLVVELIAGLV